jgi:short-subunit dehydrogenase involved in D-alanine esterification of teichoic acids
MDRLKGKRTLITGGTTGIGLETALGSEIMLDGGMGTL